MSIQGPDLSTIHADIGSNGTIDTSTMSQPGTYVIGNDAGSPSQFVGKAVASSRMNDWGGSPDDYRFGVCGDIRTGCASIDTRANFSPVPAGQLTMWVNSNCIPPGCTCNQYPPASGADYCAAQLSHYRGAGTINVPYGSLNFDDSCGPVGTVNGTVATATANWILFTGCANFNSHGWLSAPSTPYSNFTQLRSWKDQ